MPDGKPHYRRILFFYAHDVKTIRIRDYFKDACRIEIDDQDLCIDVYMDETGEPNGFAYIEEYRTDSRFFASFRHGELEGLCCHFKVRDREYAFDDACIYYQGRRTTLLKEDFDEIRRTEDQYGLTVISWS